MRTPDGTDIVSRHRHDYVTYKDANGETYMVDGGLAYLRRSLNVERARETSLYTDAPHEELRDGVRWGKRNRDQSVNYVKIRNLSKAHINAILRDGYTGPYIDIMIAELGYRLDTESKSDSKRLEVQRENSYG